MILRVLIMTTILLGLSPRSRENGRPQAPSENASFKRLPPSAFTQLPHAVRRHLQARRCLIPQRELKPMPHNVINGAFARPGQRDWAVLCSRNGFSSILVFWNGQADAVAELAVYPDNRFMQRVVRNGKTDYGREINAVGKGFITRHYHKESGAPKPPPIKHQGIDDGFMDVASIVRYYYRGKWRELAGSD